MNYRPEINGMRAIAVIPVILFHAGVETFSGGFLGVDIFFVISGYLITTIILLDLKSDNFDIITFFDRRIRRLMPALFVMLLVTIPFAWLWLPPIEMKEYAVSLVTSVTSSSNILFWLKSGYFGSVVEQKPLVHTWSLAVEQQFYIIFPFLMLFIWKYIRSSLTIIFILMLLASLFVAQWAVYSYPSGAFYLLPTRFWQILMGSLCAVWLLKGHDRFDPYANSLSMLGLFLVIVSFFTFDQGSRVPGFSALIPTIGAVLIILFAVNNNLVAKLLSQKFLIGIGLISYSLYLWHQPIFVFIRISGLSEFAGDWVFSIAILCCFALSYFSWKYVERPWRNRSVFSTKIIYSVNAVSIALVAAIGLYVEKKDGFPSSAQEYKYALDVDKLIAGDTFLIGDSHAGHLEYGLNSLLARPVSNGYSGGCIPFYNVDRYDFRFNPGDCTAKMNANLDRAISEKKPGNVILATMGPVYLDAKSFRGKDENRVTGLVVTHYDFPNIDDHWKVFELGMRETIKKLTHESDHNVVFVVDNPELGIDLGCQSKNKTWEIFGVKIRDLNAGSDPKSCKIPRAEFDARAQKYREFVIAILKDYPKVKLFDPTQLFCDESWCYGYKEEFGYLYRDFDHLSKNGSIMVGKELIKLLE